MVASNVSETFPLCCLIRFPMPDFIEGDLLECWGSEYWCVSEAWQQTQGQAPLKEPIGTYREHPENQCSLLTTTHILGRF